MACIISVLSKKNIRTKGDEKRERNKYKKESERLWERRTERRNERNNIKIMVSPWIVGGSHYLRTVAC